MKRYTSTIGLTAAAFALSLTPLWAQDRSRPADSPTVGSAVPRDSGSSSGSSSSSGSGGSSTSSSGGSSSSGSASSGWMGNGGYEAPRRAPVNPERAENGDQRRGGGSTTGRAVPRGDGGNSGTASSGSTRSNDGNDRQGQGRSRAVPTYSRPRDGRNPIGTAVERTDGYYRNGRPYSYSTFGYDPYYSYYYDPYYRSRYYWSPWGYGYGFGYMAYDPFLFGGFGYPDYYGGYTDPYYGGGYAGGGYYGGGGYSSGASQVYRGVGSLRLKVKPGHAQVFVDGYFVGTVDSFDGVFQRLNIEGGSHKIELRADGYEPTQFDVMVIPGETITYKGDMRRR